MIDHNTSRRILRVQKRTPTELDRDVGARVRMRRMMLGLSQAALAEQCSISAQQIHKYESGLSRLTTSRLVQISQALAAPVDWFFGEAIDERALPDDLFDMLSDHDNLELLRAVHRITNPAVKRQIIGVIDALETGDSGSEALARLAPGEACFRRRFATATPIGRLRPVPVLRSRLHELPNSATSGFGCSRV